MQYILCFVQLSKIMANLNFQQPPRSIANQSLSRGGFSTSSLSGHVTPTSGMFPTSLASSFPPQQLSPNRNLPPMGSRALFGQRAFPDRRTMPGLSGSNPMGSMGSFGIPQNRGYGSQGGINSFHSVFGGGGDTNTPPLLDLSEFPSLTNRGQGDSMPQPSPMPGKQPYGSNPVSNMVGMFGNPQNRYFESQEAINDLDHGRQERSIRSMLDISEFPFLTSRGQGVSVTDHIPLGGQQLAGAQKNVSMCEAKIPEINSFKYHLGMVKQPTAESSEFTMSSEDFPALPGTQNQDGPSPSGEKSLSGQNSECSQETTPANRAPGAEKSQASKRGIQTSPDGKVTNIPGSMVKDQFGMVGLLTFIRAAETDPNLVSLALGQDLTALGLNLNSPENLYPNFGGPWAETPCRPQDIDFHVPPEYLINSTIREKLAPVKLNRYKDDLLFYMFYTNVGDVLQLAAASELYNRDWRYHTEEKVWITRAPGMALVEKTTTYERGTYYFFDAQNWRKVAKEFHLDYNKLEDRPHLPPTFHHNAAPVPAV